MLAPWQSKTVPVTALGPVATSLADDDTSSLIINAIDLVISRARG